MRPEKAVRGVFTLSVVSQKPLESFPSGGSHSMSCCCVVAYVLGGEPEPE